MSEALTKQQKIGKLMVNLAILPGVWGFMEVAMKGQRVGWEMLAVYVVAAAALGLIGAGLLRTRYAIWGVLAPLMPIASVVLNSVMK